MFGRLLHAGGMFYREGSGALSPYVRSPLEGSSATSSRISIPTIALARSRSLTGAGGKINDFLANDGLWKGNRVIAGSAEIYPALEGLFGRARMMRARAMRG